MGTHCALHSLHLMRALWCIHVTRPPRYELGACRLLLCSHPKNGAHARKHTRPRVCMPWLAAPPRIYEASRDSAALDLAIA